MGGRAVRDQGMGQGLGVPAPRGGVSHLVGDLRLKISVNIIAKYLPQSDRNVDDGE
jgi:hypothetical protein